jgi:hypothetical protein
MERKKGNNMNDIEIEELDAWNDNDRYYFWQVLNGEKSLIESIEDIKSFINSKYYTGTQEKYRIIGGE